MADHEGLHEGMPERRHESMSEQMHGDKVDCRAALVHLQDYLKREITPELAVEIKQHLERCRPCFNHARFEENFLQMLATRVGCVTCPDMLRARIIATLRATMDEV